MDNIKTGILIRKLRIEKHLTQKELAEKINLTDKAVSRWERGCGAPDMAYVQKLSDVLGISSETLLEGTLPEDTPTSGNLKKMAFYVCPTCGNIIFSLRSASISCCGRKLKPLSHRKAETDEEQLNIVKDDTEIFITSDHKMTKDDYISFIAVISSETCLIRKLYPEWNVDLHLPLITRHGLIFHYSRMQGLIYQIY